MTTQMNRANLFQTPLWREPAGAIPNCLALGYAAFGYITGFLLMASPSAWINFIGVLLTAHAILIAAYSVHEAAHYTLFARPAANRLLRTFHCNRLKRILDDDYGAVGTGENRMAQFSGAHGVFFLTVV